MNKTEDQGPWIVWEGWAPWSTSHAKGDGTYETHVHQDWCRVVVNHHGEFYFYQRYFDEHNHSAAMSMCSWLSVTEIGDIDCLNLAEHALRELWRANRINAQPCDHAKFDAEIQSLTAALAEAEERLETVAAERARLCDELIVAKQQTETFTVNLTLAERRIETLEAEVESLRAEKLIAQATESVPQGFSTSSAAPDRREIILACVRQHGARSAHQLAVAADCSDPTARKYARILVEEGAIQENEDGLFVDPAFSTPSDNELPSESGESR